MPKAKIYDIEGKQAGEKELDASVFGVRINPNVVHEVMVGLQANARRSYAHTKTKGEVRGGGKKPWAQKGTGRARQGSTRNPQWIGGGITFGPRSERDYAKKINAKTKKRAFAMALSDKLSEGKLILVEKLVAKDGKTKNAVAALAKLPVQGRTVLVNAGKDELYARSVRNLRDVHLVGVGSLSLLDVLRAKHLVLTVDAVEKIEKTYSSKKA